MIRPTNASLQLAPKSLNRVRVRHAPHILLELVLNHAVSVALRQLSVGSVFIRHNQRSGFDVLDNKRINRFGGRMGGNFGRDTPAALRQTNHWRLVLRAAPTLPLALTADIGFINLHDLRELPHGRGAQDPHLLGNSPRRFIRYAKLTLKLFGRHPVLRVSEQVDGIKPRLERCVRFVKDRVCQRVQLVSAVLTGVAFAFLHAVERGALLTARTDA